MNIQKSIFTKEASPLSVFIGLKKEGTLRTTRENFLLQKTEITTVLSTLPRASLLFSHSVPGMTSDLFPVL